MSVGSDGGRDDEEQEQTARGSLLEALMSAQSASICPEKREGIYQK